MPNALLDHYSGQRADLERQIQAITDLAFQREDKQLSDQDREGLSVLQGKLDRVTADIEAVSKRSDLSQSARDALRANDIRASESGHAYRSVGQVLWDIMHRSDDAHAGQRWDQFRMANPEGATMQRAAQHMGTTAEATTPTAGGFGSLFVSPVRGPVIDFGWTGTPFLNLLSPQEIQTPGPFLRPRIIDPDRYTAAGPQAGGLQKGELPSKKWDYANELVTPETVGNYINLSLQAQTWVPNALDMVVSTLRTRTEVAAEKAAIDRASQTTKTVALASDSAEDVQKGVWEAMAAVFTATGQPASWLALGPNGAAFLGGIVDLAGRPLFPVLGPNNALGSADAGRVIAPFGLSVAVTPGIADDTFYLGNGAGLEAYIYRYPVLDALEPSVVGRQLAVAIDLAFYAPPTVEAGPGGTPAAEYGAIVKITAP